MIRRAGPRNPVANTRVALLEAGATVLFLLLLLAFWEIQVLDSSAYLLQARQNRTEAIPVPAGRGAILDRHGRVLATSVPARYAMLSIEQVQPSGLNRLVKVLGLEPGGLRERIDSHRSSGWSQYVLLKQILTDRDVAYLAAHRSEFPEVELIEGMRRLYPSSGVAAHAVGYVAAASQAELESREFLLYDHGQRIGKVGVERQYNSWLAGQDGQALYLVDSRGRRLDQIGIVEPVPGKPLRLTLDLDLQAVSELGLEGQRGAVVALDPRNGEILAMASSPAFDQNRFFDGMSAAEWTRMHHDSDTPLLNRAIQGTWAMGSVFKPIHGLAGLETGVVEPGYTVHCPGGMQYGRRFYRCHKREGHGVVDLRTAIAVSCDVFFYTLGLDLGIDTLSRYARSAGLGARTRVDLPGEVPGLVPSVQWSVRTNLLPWRGSDTVVVSIGQGAMSVTPIQAAYAIGGLAMGGVWHRPRMVSREQEAAIDPSRRPQPPSLSPIASGHMDELREAMWRVVNGGGTGGQAQVRGIEVCGKTGTSQRVSNELRLRANREEFEDDAWFVGFAPCRSPEVVVAVLLENGRHSYRAAALARDVVRVWLLGRDRESPGAPASMLAAARGGRGTDVEDVTP